MRKFITPRDTKRFYNGIGHKLYQLSMKLASYQKLLSVIMKQLLDHVELKGGDKILDVGIGTGIVSINLLKECKKDVHVVGIDISKKQLEIAKRHLKREKLEGTVELHMADASKLPFDDNSFAFVISTGMIEHLGMHRDLKRVKSATCEFVRVLKPGCKLFILTVNDTFWGKITTFMWQMGYYSEDDVKDMMKNAGLKDVEMISFDIKGPSFQKSDSIMVIGTKP